MRKGFPAFSFPHHWHQIRLLAPAQFQKCKRQRTVGSAAGAGKGKREIRLGRCVDDKVR